MAVKRGVIYAVAYSPSEGVGREACCDPLLGGDNDNGDVDETFYWIWLRISHFWIVSVVQITLRFPSN
jgi:hypothetical protein